eukprot:Gb_06788 [translate_table: standard]
MAPKTSSRRVLQPCVVQHKQYQTSILDQSPNQLAKAKQKEALKEFTFLQGDAEDLPFPTDYAHRYYSLGRIEYWPEPQREINEVYRVVKEGWEGLYSWACAPHKLASSVGGRHMDAFPQRRGLLYLVEES